jgi:hypothetical protein
MMAGAVCAGMKPDAEVIPLRPGKRRPVLAQTLDGIRPPDQKDREAGTSSRPSEKPIAFSVGGVEHDECLGESAADCALALRESRQDTRRRS